MRAAGLLLIAACGRLGFAPPVDDGGPGTGDSSRDVLDDGDAQLAGSVRVTLAATGECPVAAWSGDSIGAAWREPAGTSSSNLRFARYAVDGTLLQGPLTVAPGIQNAGCPAILWSGARFLVVVNHGALNQTDLALAPVDSGGAGAFNTVTTETGNTTEPRLAIIGTTVLLTFLIQMGGNYSHNSLTLDQAGGVIGSSQQLGGNSSQPGRPAITSTGTNFAVTWVDTGQPRLRLASNGGTPVGAELGVANFTGLGTASDPVANLYTGSDLVIASRTESGMISSAVISNAGMITNGPHQFATPSPRELAMMWGSTTGMLLYLEIAGLVQYHVATVAADGRISNDVGLVSGKTTGTSALAWTGSQFVAAVDTNLGAALLLVTP